MANTQLNAKLVACHVPTSNNAAAQQFYNTLFGGNDFARSLNNTIQSYFRPISQDGLTLTIAPRNDAREPITCFFAVADLSTTVSELVAAGGKVVQNSTSLAASASATSLKKATAIQPSTNLGHFVTMQDPDGNYLGLIQVDSSMQSWFNAQPANMTLTSTQVTQQQQSITAGATLA